MTKREYLRRRKQRVRELYFEGYEEGRVIAEMLIAEGSIETKSLESAIHLVRGDLAELKERLAKCRANGDPTPTSETEALERQLRGLREDLEYQLWISKGEPDEKGSVALTTTVVDMPGVSYNSVREAVPRGIRQKARKDASRLRDRIAEVERELASMRSDVAASEGDGSVIPGLTIVEDGRTLAEQIEANNFRVN